jgi:hypothetical protein
MIVPDPGYVIADVQVDGKSIGAINSYTFTNVKKNMAIRATFKQSSSNEWVWSRDGWDGWTHSLCQYCSPDLYSEYGPIMVNGHGEHGINLLSDDGGYAYSVVYREFLIPAGSEWNTATVVGRLSAINDRDGRWMQIAINGGVSNGGTNFWYYPTTNGEQFEYTFTFPSSKNKVTIAIFQVMLIPWTEPKLHMEFYSLKFTKNNSLQLPDEGANSISLTENSQVTEGTAPTTTLMN